MTPQTSSVARRMKVARSASGEGARPFASILHSTKASSGVRTHSFWATTGKNCGCTGCQDHKGLEGGLGEASAGGAASAAGAPTWAAGLSSAAAARAAIETVVKSATNPKPIVFLMSGAPVDFQTRGAAGSCAVNPTIQLMLTEVRIYVYRHYRKKSQPDKVQQKMRLRPGGLRGPGPIWHVESY